MKPYGNANKGIAGCRKSAKTSYRERSLRTDKKRERQASKKTIKDN